LRPATPEPDQMVGLIFCRLWGKAGLKCDRCSSAFIVARAAHSVMLGASKKKRSPAEDTVMTNLRRIDISSVPPEVRMPRRNTE